jgi:hypothetical protein|tara:strand:- start:114 stop:506 length:393 start_codon:yes stop_codon:yes gene_type:complete
VGHTQQQDILAPTDIEDILDPSWKIKQSPTSERVADAVRFFEEVRIQFSLHDLLQNFPILLEHHLRSDVRRQVAISGLRTLRGDFHVQTICRYLEDSDDGVFSIERHLPPDMEEDLTLLLKALERAFMTQ